VTARVTREELRELLDAADVSLIEALPVEAYEAEHIPGAVNVPGVLTSELAARIAPDPDRTVVVYCSGPACSRSKATAAAFERLGYTDVRIYPGGKLDWWEAGLPLVGIRTPGAHAITTAAKESIDDIATA
jgi:rhodanese-related sulfurtransferase